MVKAIKRGDKIITSGGIFGIVEKVMDNDKVEVSISDNVNIELVKSTGIQALINNTEQKK
jgi:preprotein translocase subunit YajC